MGYTRATLGDLTTAEATATQTGAAATASGDRAGTVAGDMEAGVIEVTDALRSHFEQLVTTMQDQSARAMSRLGTADWEGKSREMAIQADASLKARLDGVLGAALTGTEEFRQSLSVDAQAFVDGVRGQFATVMNSVDLAFQDLAAAEAAFAQNLVEADETVQLG
jgi:hypothetical protein